MGGKKYTNNKCGCPGIRVHEMVCTKCPFPKNFYIHMEVNWKNECPSNVFDFKGNRHRINKCVGCSISVCSENCSVHLGNNQHICHRCFRDLRVNCHNCGNMTNRKKICADRTCNNIICLDCYQDSDQCFKHKLLDNMDLAFPHLPQLVNDTFKHYIDKSFANN